VPDDVPRWYQNEELFPGRTLPLLAGWVSGELHAWRKEHTGSGDVVHIRLLLIDAGRVAGDHDGGELPWPEPDFPGYLLGSLGPAVAVLSRTVRGMCQPLGPEQA
jgi:hypothetical protein